MLSSLPKYMPAAEAAQLAARIAHYEARWSLRCGPAFPDLSYHYVAPAVLSDGSDAVLKLRGPGQQCTCEVAALQRFDGRGAARLLQADEEEGALLLERLQPGTLLVELVEQGRDEEATSIAAGVMQKLWRRPPPEHQFPTVAQWAGALSKLRPHYGGTTGPFPRELVEEAETTFAELTANPEEQLLLHGDVHHFNILAAGREPWLAIDPQGVIGERGFELGPLLQNPRPLPASLLARRLDQLCEELHLDRSRTRAWAMAQSVLSAWWCVEDGAGCEEVGILCCRRLAEVPA
ncbi:MAG: phosphotransferase [Armatimonadetes bacterium]|nr:phosphotransferase [Armatimonadota bacterium]MDE2205726.1 phosphotransferase [Armatimonadota bacterium]